MSSDQTVCVVKSQCGGLSIKPCISLAIRNMLVFSQCPRAGHISIYSSGKQDVMSESSLAGGCERCLNIALD